MYDVAKMMREEFPANTVVRFYMQGRPVVARVMKPNRKTLKLRVLSNFKGCEEGSVWHVSPHSCIKVPQHLAEPYLRDDKAPGKVKDANTYHAALKAACSMEQPPHYIRKPEAYLTGAPLVGCGTERDNQRNRVYTSERGVIPSQRFETCAEARTYLNSVCKSSWFVERFGEHHVPLYFRGSVKSVAYGCVYTSPDKVQICISKNFRDDLTILHELAHVLIGSPHPPHGPLFCTIYLDLVKTFAPSLAPALEANFRKNRVKFQVA